MSSTHTEYVGEGYSVRVQHCEKAGCDKYLGVNYPSKFCDEHQEKPVSTTYDPLSPPPEPPVGTWVKDRHGGVSLRRQVTVENGLQLTGWGKPGIEPYGKWKNMWAARGPLVECGPWGEDLPEEPEQAFKVRQIVVDPKGNHFAIDEVTDQHVRLHSVATKQVWTLTPDYARSELVVVEGLVEA